MEKVPLSTWGGTKVRNNLKDVWPEAEAVQNDADFGQYQQALATTVQNTNELIDYSKHMEAVLARRPF